LEYFSVGSELNNYVQSKKKVQPNICKEDVLSKFINKCGYAEHFFNIVISEFCNLKSNSQILKNVTKLLKQNGIFIVPIKQKLNKEQLSKFKFVEIERNEDVVFYQKQ
jgi:hypothetical protein